MHRFQKRLPLYMMALLAALVLVFMIQFSAKIEMFFFVAGGGSILITGTAVAISRRNLKKFTCPCCGKFLYGFHSGRILVTAKCPTCDNQIIED